MSVEEDTGRRWAITISIMLATMMNSLDATIANVALPHVQGSVSASQEQITWVLTSYIVAAALLTPMTGWLADRLGRKRLFIISIVGFTVASMMCGVSSALPEIVVARLLQGAFGAALVPLSQAVLLDIYPPEKHGQAMSIWGAGAILGPVLGPALGGWLTEHLSWRWVFFINVPIGAVALAGVLLFISGDKPHKAKPFDFVGFGALVVFIGAFQLMLDRGPSLDWFESREIWAETLLALMGLWVFVFHTPNAKHPFFDLALLRDRNFVMASIMSFFVSIMLFSVMALWPTMMQNLMGYPVLTSGLVSVPRGVGLFLMVIVAGRLVGRIDTRLLIFLGLLINAVTLWQMTQFDLTMTAMPLIVSGFVQGLGLGLIFIPITTLAFSTVAPRLRGEGSSLFNLVRNLGGSAGISIMQAIFVANIQVMHADLAAKVDPSDPLVRDAWGSAYNLSSPAGLEAVSGELTRQATMIAYINDFKLMLFITLACMPMLLLVRRARTAPGDRVHAVVD